MEFDLITFLAQIFNFLVLLWILKKFLYSPILNAMKERREGIVKSLEDVEAKQREVDTLKDENEKVLESVRKEKIKMIKKAEAEVKKDRDEMLQEVEKEREAAHKEFEEHLEIEKKRFVVEVNKVVANKFTDFAQNVFSELSGSDIESQVIGVFLEKIKSLSKAEIEKINKSAKIVNGEITITTANDLAKDLREKVKKSLESIGVNFKTIKFEKDKKIILGIMLQAGSYIVSWDLKEFLNSFKEELTKILK